MSILEGGTNKRPAPAFTTGTVSASTAQKKKAKNEDRIYGPPAPSAEVPAWLKGGAAASTPEWMNGGAAASTTPAWMNGGGYNNAPRWATTPQGTGSFMGGGGAYVRGVNNNPVYTQGQSVPYRLALSPSAQPYDKGALDDPTIPTGTFLAANGQAARYGESNTYNPLGNNDNPWLMIQKKKTTSSGGGSSGGSSGGWGRGGGGGWGSRSYSDWGNNGYTPTTYTQKEYDPNMGLYSWNFKG